MDDGSTDGSWAEVARLTAGDTRFRAIRLIRNFGEHVAITAGLDRVDADYVVIMACDLQDDPAAIAAMLAAAGQGADLVLVRRLKRRDAWLKRTLARVFYALISLLFHIDYDYRVGNFRMLTRRAVESFRQHRERMRNVNAIMALMGLRTAYVDVTHRARRHGKSTYTLGRSARMAASVIIGYSDIPLLVSGAFGGLLLVGAVVWGAVLMGRSFSGRAMLRDGGGRRRDCRHRRTGAAQSRHRRRLPRPGGARSQGTPDVLRKRRPEYSASRLARQRGRRLRSEAYLV